MLLTYLWPMKIWRCVKRCSLPQPHSRRHHRWARSFQSPCSTCKRSPDSDRGLRSRQLKISKWPIQTILCVWIRIEKQNYTNFYPIWLFKCFKCGTFITFSKNRIKINYIDFYLFVSSDTLHCKQAQDSFREICNCQH